MPFLPFLSHLSIRSSPHAAMVVYHHLSTLDAEYQHFWVKRKFGFGWTFFLVNRYLPLATSLSEAPWWSGSRDHTVSHVTHCLCLVQYTEPCASLGVRPSRHAQLGIRVY